MTGTIKPLNLAPVVVFSFFIAEDYIQCVIISIYKGFDLQNTVHNKQYSIEITI